MLRVASKTLRLVKSSQVQNKSTLNAIQANSKNTTSNAPQKFTKMSFEQRRKMSSLSGTSSEYISKMFETYQRDPQSLHPMWIDYFQKQGMTANLKG